MKTYISDCSCSPACILSMLRLGGIRKKKAELRGLKVLPPHGAWVTVPSTSMIAQFQDGWLRFVEVLNVFDSFVQVF